MTAIDEAKKEFATLAGRDKSYANADLSYEEQTYERGKPADYLQATVNLVSVLGGRSIVEIGCMRSLLSHPLSEIHPACCNDGHSTYWWCTTNANVISIDISKSAVNIARKSCKGFQNCRIICQDGLKFLKDYKSRIDLLYLDAWDVDPNHHYAENHLMAFLLAKDQLSSRHIISIDDTDIASGGKGRLLIPVLKADGYEILVEGRQTIALKGAS